MGLSYTEVGALMHRFTYVPGFSFTRSGAVYLKTVSSYPNRELYQRFGAVLNPGQKYWAVRSGRNLRRAYDGVWFIDGVAVFGQCMK